MLNLNDLSDEEILDLKIKDLPLSFKESRFAHCLLNLHSELSLQGIKFRPILWISDEWFCPEGVSGIAIPFYLMHERLTSIERSFMGEAEGALESHFMKLLRHECGHALDNAYFLKDCELRTKLFGDHQKRYPDHYEAKKYSRKFVNHLGDGYAQAHPEEDWAETFATWLDPKSAWKKEYGNWPAIKKLDYLSLIMKELKERAPNVVCYQKVDEYTEFDFTLKDYYAYKVKKFKKTNIKRVSVKHIGEFIDRSGSGIDLAHELKINRKLLKRRVARATNQYQYRIETVIRDLEGVASIKGLKIMKRSKLNTTLEKIVIGHTKKFLAQGKHKVIM